MKKLPLLFFILLFVTFSAGVFLRLHFLDVRNRSADEVYYMTYAREIASNGIGSTANLIDAYFMDPGNWIYPPPTRIGYIGAVAAADKIAHRSDAMPGVYVSCLCSLLSLGVLAFLGLRHFRGWVSLIGLLFLSVSPMDLAIGRRVWADSLMSFLSALLLIAIGEIHENPKKRFWYFFYALLGGYSLLVKESAAIVFALGALWILSVLLRRKLFKEAVFFIAFCILAAETAVFFLKWVSGDLSTVTTLLRHVKDSIPSNAYAAHYQNDSAWKFLESLWLLSPVSIFFAWIGIAVSLKKRQGFPFGVSIFIVVVLLFILIAPYFKNLRYASVVYVPYYLMAGVGAVEFTAAACLRLKSSLLKNAVITLVVFSVIAGAFGDYLNFRRLFIERKIQDLLSGPIHRHSLYLMNQRH